MQHGKNPAKKTREVEDIPVEAPPVIPDEASDDEYEEVPSRQAKRAQRDNAPAAVPTVQKISENRPIKGTGSEEPASGHADSDAMEVDGAGPATAAAAATAAADDDDWLRQRTNRLLDLVGADELDAEMPEPARAAEPRKSEPGDPMDEDQEEPEQGASEDQSATQPSEPKKGVKETPLDSVRRTSRIFVRNLPYTATEDELRQYFAKFGELEEVSLPAISLTLPPSTVMNP